MQTQIISVKSSQKALSEYLITFQILESKKISLEYLHWVPGEERAVKQESTEQSPWTDERGPLSVRWTLECFRCSIGKVLRDGVWCIYVLSQAHKYHLELNSTFGEAAKMRFSAPN